MEFGVLQTCLGVVCLVGGLHALYAHCCPHCKVGEKTLLALTNTSIARCEFIAFQVSSSKKNQKGKKGLGFFEA